MATPPEPFKLAIHSGFSEDGIWQIDCRLEWRDGTVPPDGSKLLGEGRVAMMGAIVQAGLEGRRLGARRVHCSLVGHRADGVENVMESWPPAPDNDRPA